MNDLKIVKPISYGTMSIPPVGISALMSEFATSVVRLSNALGTRDDANEKPGLPWISNEYSVPSSFNSDNSFLLLQHGSYFGLYQKSGASYSFVQNLPFEIHASAEPRWSRKQKNLLYYVSGNRLKAYTVGAAAGVGVANFPEYARVFGRGKSDVCYDGDHVVLVGDNRFVFVYSLSTGAKSAAIDLGGRAFESVNVCCPYPGVTVGFNASGTGRFNGVELFGFDGVFQRQLCASNGHMDLARDVDGKAYLVWTSSNDPAPRVLCENGIVKIDLQDGKQTCLLSLSWDLAVHIAGSDVGYACVSTYAPNNPSPAGHWPPFCNEVLRIRLDGTSVERLVHHRSLPFNSYNWMPKASLSRDATKVVFASNWGKGEPEYSDAYLIDLGAPTPVPAPTPAPTVDPRVTALEEKVQTLESRVSFEETKRQLLEARLAKLLIDLGKAAQ